MIASGDSAPLPHALLPQHSLLEKMQALRRLHPSAGSDSDSEIESLDEEEEQPDVQADEQVLVEGKADSTPEAPAEEGSRDAMYQDQDEEEDVGLEEVGEGEGEEGKDETALALPFDPNWPSRITLGFAGVVVYPKDAERQSRSNFENRIREKFEAIVDETREDVGIFVSQDHFVDFERNLNIDLRLHAAMSREDFSAEMWRRGVVVDFPAAAADAPLVEAGYEGGGGKGDENE